MAYQYAAATLKMQERYMWHWNKTATLVENSYIISA